MSDTKVELTNEQFTDLIASAIEKAVNNLGLDKVDRKFGVFPTDDDPDGKKVEEMSSDEKILKFFQAVIFKDFATLSELKALGETTNTAGGYLVPPEFRAQLIEELPKITVMRQVATIIPVNAPSGNLPKVTAKPTVTIGSENTVITETSATFGELTWQLQRLNALIPMSRELVADAKVDIVSLIRRWFAEAIAQKEDELFTNGTGTGEPEGFRVNTVNIATIALGDATNGGATPTYDNIVDLIASVQPQYRRRCVFMTSPKGESILMKIKDGQGRPLFTQAQDGGIRILGYPLVVNANIPENLNATGAGKNNETEIWFGDFSYYWVFDKQEYAVETTTEGYGAFEKHQVVMKVTNYIDGKRSLDVPFAVMTGVV